MGGCQKYGPFLGPYYNTAPIIYFWQTHIELYRDHEQPKAYETTYQILLGPKP